MKKENVVSLNAPKYVQQTYFTLRRPHHRTCTFRPWCVEPYDSFAALSYQICLFYAERDCFLCMLWNCPINGDINLYLEEKTH